MNQVPPHKHSIFNQSDRSYMYSSIIMKRALWNGVEFQRRVTFSLNICLISPTESFSLIWHVRNRASGGEIYDHSTQFSRMAMKKEDSLSFILFSSFHPSSTAVCYSLNSYGQKNITWMLINVNNVIWYIVSGCTGSSD